MQITMFGSLTVRDHDRRLGPGDLGGVKPKQVLELLLLARGHLVSTDALADALWPEVAPRDTAATLNSYVSVLRRRMFDDRAMARRVLVTASKAYWLSPEEVSIDRDRFDDLLVRSERAPRSERLRLLSDAVALADGDLLEDAPFDAWVQEERILYRERLTRAHLVLARDWLAEGEPATGLRHAEAAVMMARYSEEAYRLVMLANHTLGNREIARRAFERCRAVLGDELGIDCTTETEQMAGAIEAGVPAADIVVGSPGRVPTPRIPATRHLPPPVTTAAAATSYLRSIG